MDKEIIMFGDIEKQNKNYSAIKNFLTFQKDKKKTTLKFLLYFEKWKFVPSKKLNSIF